MAKSRGGLRRSRQSRLPETRFDASHDRFVDVAFALFAPFDLNFVVEQFLPVDNGQPAFFRLGGVDQHSRKQPENPDFHGSRSFGALMPDASP
jgi:hypothetical protein